MNRQHRAVINNQSYKVHNYRMRRFKIKLTQTNDTTKHKVARTQYRRQNTRKESCQMNYKHNTKDKEVFCSPNDGGNVQYITQYLA